MICVSEAFPLLIICAVFVFHQEQVLVEGSGDAVPPECKGEYRDSPGHTMCMHDDTKLVKSGVSNDDKKIIVDLHNHLRAHVDPPATDLAKLIWDDKLAAVADKWAKQCGVGHDKNRKIPSYGVPVGQNVAAGYSDWEGAIMGWYNEVNMFKYGEDPEVYLGKGGWKKVGHYTQVVQNTAFRVGCGYAECTSTSYGRYYVCNYVRAQTRISKPYTNGTQCSACPTSCTNGLCDCNGKLCKNNGVLNIDTCECECVKVYKGAECDTLECPEYDANRCWNYVFPKHCNVPSVVGDCPYMCGRCGGPNGATPPPIFVSKHNCSYQGRRPSVEKCADYGDAGADTKNCDSRGGQFTCQDCKKFGNVKYEYCPVMCGVCDGPCDGKNCKNGGTLDRSTCTCTCPPPYAGETCEKTECPDTMKDSGHCWKTFKPEHCKKYRNVPEMCPWMCGVCGTAGATPPPVHTSPFGCIYEGQQKSKEECKTYGKDGADTGACASNGGPFKCEHCTKYRNVKEEYCPVMCGICQP